MEFSVFEALFRQIFAQNGLYRFCEPAIIEQFWRFTELFVAENAKTNLSAIRDPREIIAKHYADCLLAEPFLPEGARVLDVGCGGGFPCVPFAIVRRDLQITALDSTQKKLDFVAKAAKELGFSNFQTLCGRAEELAQGTLREQFDLVVSRAVANLPVLAELTLPFVRVGGSLLALKGAKGSEEMASAKRAIAVLGGKTSADHAKTLFCPTKAGDFAEESRHLLLIDKEKRTPSVYPRSYASILKRPL